MGVGAVVGVVAQGVSDLISWELSGWENYMGAAVGGAAAGEAFLYTGNPVVAGAAYGFTSSVTTQGLQNLTGKRSGFDLGAVAQSTAIGAATGAVAMGAGKVLGKVGPKLGQVMKGQRGSVGLGKGKFSVYEGIDEAGIVRYVGRTGRESWVRWAEHKASDTALANLRYRTVRGLDSLTTKAESRYWEQTLINKHGLGKNGGFLLNKINSVAPKYWRQWGII
ncbi:hypothetical protein ACFLW2_04495 [Chloroflexota bacterium]